MLSVIQSSVLEVTKGGGHAHMMAPFCQLCLVDICAAMYQDSCNVVAWNPCCKTDSMVFECSNTASAEIAQRPRTSSKPMDLLFAAHAMPTLSPVGLSHPFGMGCEAGSIDLDTVAPMATKAGGV